MQKVWSFKDCTVVYYHPAIGSIDFVGSGTGSVVIAWAGDIAVHDVGAAGEVVTSKMEVDNGTITLTVLQTSEANDYLVKYANYIKVAPSNEFNQGVCNIKNNVTGETVNATGCAPQKMADVNMQAQQQSRSWGILSEHMVAA